MAETRGREWPLLDLLRHGDTGQPGFRGRLDDALTVSGWAQMRAAVAEGAWDLVLSSPLRRCADFARELAAARGLPLHFDPRLAEYGFGAWEGVPLDELAAREGDALARFWADPAAAPPPGGECFHAFAARVLGAVLDPPSVTRDGAWTTTAGPRCSPRLLVVTHGGVIRLLHCLASGRGYGDMAQVSVPHASLHRIDLRPLAERTSVVASPLGGACATMPGPRKDAA